jgi:hypothetical protein
VRVLSYGPHAAFNKLVTKLETILNGEESKMWKIGVIFVVP